MTEEIAKKEQAIQKPEQGIPWETMEALLKKDIGRLTSEERKLYLACLMQSKGLNAFFSSFQGYCWKEGWSMKRYHWYVTQEPSAKLTLKGPHFGPGRFQAAVPGEV